MDKLFTKLRILFEDKALRKRILFIFIAMIIFRLLSTIPIPGVNIARLESFIRNNQFLGVLNIFSGGGLSTLSILMLGVGPYITSSIIMQLLTIMSPKIKAMYQEDGEIGRKKFNQISRVLTVPLAIIQGIAFIFLLKSQGVITHTTLMSIFTDLTVVVAGSILIMWIGELISEFGIGDGVSFIIFAGIVAVIPRQVSQFFFTFNVADIPMYILFTAIGLLIIAGVVILNEAERPISVTYAKQIRGEHVAGGTQTYLPIRVNQAGVMPIIFALSILLFPQLIGNFLVKANSAILQNIAHGLVWFSQTAWLYSLVYFLFVFLFTYFYTAITFDPDQVAENLQKNGAFVPGVRPGNATREYITKILNRITTMGGFFLGIIAVLPLIMKSITGVSSFAIGGTALLIVVAVVLDLIQRIDAQLSMREY